MTLRQGPDIFLQIIQMIDWNCIFPYVMQNHTTQQGKNLYIGQEIAQ